MNVVITGATGFVGQRLCERLSGRYTTIPVTRKATGAAQSCVVEDLGTPFELSQPSPCVIHLAGLAHRKDESSHSQEYERINVEGTRNLLEASLRQGLKRFIFVSTIKVYGEYSKQAFDESTPLNPVGPYAKSKATAEALVQEYAAQHGFDYLIIRPPLVYATHALGNIQTLSKWLKKGFPLPLAGLNNQRSMISLDGLCEFIEHGLESKQGLNQAYVVKDLDLSTSEFICRLAKDLNVNPRLFYCPLSLLKGLGALAGKSEMVDKLTGSLVVDATKAQTLLRYPTR